MHLIIIVDAKDLLIISTTVYLYQCEKCNVDIDEIDGTT